MKKFSVILCLLLLLSLVGCTAEPPRREETESAQSQQTQAPAEPTDASEDSEKDSYTASDAELISNAENVVATMGDRALTVGELQLYYRNAIYTYCSQNPYYMTTMGLDLSQPLDQQYYMGDETQTWEQYFLNAALTSWQNYTAAEFLAQRDHFEVGEEIQNKIDGMPQQLESIALANGYESAQAYLDAEMTPGVSEEMYYEFNRIYVVSNEYVNWFYTAQYPDSRQIDQYYSENEETLLADGITRDMGLISSVRHILIKPKGGTTDESGMTTYTDEEWASALTQAQTLLLQWKEGEATEESFAALANTYSEDTGSATTGGLYQQVCVDSNYVPEFENWAIDENRQSGDTEVVRTTYGYHIMYFVSGESYMETLVAKRMVSEKIQEKLLALKEELPMEVHYSRILLCEDAV